MASVCRRCCNSRGSGGRRREAQCRGRSATLPVPGISDISFEQPRSNHPCCLTPFHESPSRRTPRYPRPSLTRRKHAEAAGSAQHEQHSLQCSCSSQAAWTRRCSSWRRRSGTCTRCWWLRMGRRSSSSQMCRWWTRRLLALCSRSPQSSKRCAGLVQQGQTASGRRWSRWGFGWFGCVLRFRAAPAHARAALPNSVAVTAAGAPLPGGARPAAGAPPCGECGLQMQQHSCPHRQGVLSRLLHLVPRLLHPRRSTCCPKQTIMHSNGRSSARTTGHSTKQRSRKASAAAAAALWRRGMHRVACRAVATYCVHRVALLSSLHLCNCSMRDVACAFPADGWTTDATQTSRNEPGEHGLAACEPVPLSTDTPLMLLHHLSAAR